MGDYKCFYSHLQIIHLLRQSGGYPVKRLARRFEVTTRTIYRYFDLLRGCGFEPDEQYKVQKPDPFGMNGKLHCKVTLRLKRRAARLLVGEYPECGFTHPKSREPREQDADFTINIAVIGFEGVGRFVLGLPEEATAEGPTEFAHYLEERMGRGE